MTLFKALTGGAFDRLNWQHSGKFDQNFSKKSNAPGGGAWAVLELTGTLDRPDHKPPSYFSKIKFHEKSKSIFLQRASLAILLTSFARKIMTIY